eukprot:CAMPEP_0206207836 /NCGR_PEP_ID=MMETSP0166-20121206/15832_1 /ASSEMBLY_ACC=CAM_ASM_000260 /TAXON_ID=95228 /ORGANISM="Vannella robusta, Strain DIVA3 518/3/11/1/6" /LENGTH=47 /DNA_ID= /DNA_START= /DNA_END= /DNA_ORIENTATION=
MAHLAARGKNAKILEAVLDSDRIEINDTNENGESALHKFRSRSIVNC